MATSAPPPIDPRIPAEDDYQAKKRAFREYSKQLRALTAGRRHTPAEELIRANRDSGYGREG